MYITIRFIASRNHNGNYADLGFNDCDPHLGMDEPDTLPWKHFAGDVRGCGEWKSSDVFIRTVFKSFHRCSLAKIIISDVQTMFITIFPW